MNYYNSLETIEASYCRSTITAKLLSSHSLTIFPVQFRPALMPE